MLLPLLLCLALLAGCTGTPDTAGTDTPAPAATETAGSAPASPEPTAEDELNAMMDILYEEV